MLFRNSWLTNTIGSGTICRMREVHQRFEEASLGSRPSIFEAEAIRRQRVDRRRALGTVMAGMVTVLTVVGSCAYFGADALPGADPYKGEVIDKQPRLFDLDPSRGDTVAVRSEPDLSKKKIIFEIKDGKVLGVRVLGTLYAVNPLDRLEPVCRNGKLYGIHIQLWEKDGSAPLNQFILGRDAIGDGLGERVRQDDNCEDGIFHQRGAK